MHARTRARVNAGVVLYGCLFNYAIIILDAPVHLYMSLLVHPTIALWVKCVRKRRIGEKVTHSLDLLAPQHDLCLGWD